MREIGSEFWDVPTTDNANDIFFDNIQWFLAGRSSLKAIITELEDCHTAALPSWCCDSMIKPFTDAGFEVCFYPVYYQNGLKQEINTDSDVLLLMDYFGYSYPQPDLSGYKGKIIRDVTHSVFSSKYTDADYYFGSLRKWCGVWTGGYAWTSNGHKLCMKTENDPGYRILREKAMQLKDSYIHNRGVADKDYLRLFEEAESVLDDIGIAVSDDRDVKLAQKLDVEFIKERRRANADVLRSAFPEWLLFSEIKETDCPMFVPVIVPNGQRDKLRLYLTANSIYCPVHWPVSKYHKPDIRTDYIYRNELSLVCDQRYTEDDMKQIVNTIKEFQKGV